MAIRNAVAIIVAPRRWQRAWTVGFGCVLVLSIGAHGVMTPSVSAAGGVHPLFDLSAPETAPFPFDRWTVPDRSQNTGRRVALPLPDCKQRPSDCEDIAVINTLDGFNVQPRLSIPFDGPIDVDTVTSRTVFLVNLGSTLGGRHEFGRVVGINQIVWDSPTNTLHVESDELLEQHTRYALIVTNGIRDTSGAPVKAAPFFQRFRPMQAVDAARLAGISGGRIVVASVFTTQSVTAVMEKIRDQIKAATPEPADFLVGPNKERTVFALHDVTGIAWRPQTGDNPPRFPAVPIEVQLGLLRIIPGAVGQIVFGRYVSPDYAVHPDKFIPPVATRTGVPIVQGTNEIYFNLFLPSGTKPPGGWPVALHGTGADGSKQRDVYLVATMAKHGIATLIINAVSRGWGPLGTLTVSQTGDRSVTFPAGGRSFDQNGDTMIDSQEGQNALRPHAIIGNRDAQRQTVVDYMQLVRVIEMGMDVDGDGSVDLDSSRISYFGWSFGANNGTTLLALDPSVREGALYSPGGPIFENNRLSPGRSVGFGASLASQIPSLINSPGINKLDGVAVASGPHFNENMPLRDKTELKVGLSDNTTYTIQSPVINSLAGAIAIQEYMEKRDWVVQSGNQVAFARHLRRDPLQGVPIKSVLILFGRGDRAIANPNATAMLRAGDLADRATYYLTDSAHRANSAVPKNPHGFVNPIDDSDTLVAAIARAAQVHIALFLASGGT